MLESELSTEGFIGEGRTWHFVLLASGIVILLGLLHIVAFPNSADNWICWTAFYLFAPGVIVSEIQLHKPRPFSQCKDGFVLKRSAWVAISYLILCSAWLLAGVEIATNLPQLGAAPAIFVGCCVVGIVMAFGKFIDPSPIVVINEQGYFDRNLEVGTIPWNQITGAQILNLDGTDVISLRVKDPEILKPKLTTIHLLKRKIDRVIGFELMHLGLLEFDSAYIDQALDYVLARCDFSSDETPTYPEYEELPNSDLI